MDIDEFLDKEVNAEKKEKAIEEPQVTKEDGTIASTPKKEPFIQDKYPENDSSASSEKHYFELWGDISKEKFSWNDSTYTELNKVGNEITKSIGKLSSEVQREKDLIQGLIKKAKAKLENGSHEDALKLYSQIIDIRNKIPDIFYEEKKELNEEILGLYGELHDQVDSKFIADFKASLSRVNSLVNSSSVSFESGDIEKSKKSYEQALKIYRNLPRGFLLQKIELGNNLLRLYKDLSINTQIKNLQKQLSHHNPSINRKDLGESFHALGELSGKSNNDFENKESKAVPHFHRRHLFSRLIARKIERANINMKKGFYVDAKRDIESTLKLDPNNEQANELLKKLPS